MHRCRRHHDLTATVRPCRSPAIDGPLDHLAKQNRAADRRRIAKRLHEFRGGGVHRLPFPRCCRSGSGDSGTGWSGWDVADLMTEHVANMTGHVGRFLIQRPDVTIRARPERGGRLTACGGGLRHDRPDRCRWRRRLTATAIGRSLDRPPRSGGAEKFLDLLLEIVLGAAGSRRRGPRPFLHNNNGLSWWLFATSREPAKHREDLRDDPKRDEQERQQRFQPVEPGGDENERVHGRIDCRCLKVLWSLLVVAVGGRYWATAEVGALVPAIVFRMSVSAWRLRSL